MTYRMWCLMRPPTTPTEGAPEGGENMALAGRCMRAQI